MYISLYMYCAHPPAAFKRAGPTLPRTTAFQTRKRSKGIPDPATMAVRIWDALPLSR